MPQLATATSSECTRTRQGSGVRHCWIASHKLTADPITRPMLHRNTVTARALGLLMVYTVYDIGFGA